MAEQATPQAVEPVKVAEPVKAEKTYSVPQSVIDLFSTAASKLELTLAKEELLKNIK